MKIKSKDNIILFDRSNWKIVFAGIALIIIGFLLMLGGKTKDPNIFNPDELYSFRRITLAPIAILIGFVLQIFAILKKPSEEYTVETVEKVKEERVKVKKSVDAQPEKTNAIVKTKHMSKKKKKKKKNKS